MESGSYAPKRRFMPSKWERIMINKIVQGIRLGRIKIGEKKKDPEEYRNIGIISNFMIFKSH